MERNVVIENRWLKLFEDKYSLDNGEPCTYYHVERTDAVMAIALEIERGKLYTHIVSQRRHPIDQTIWQFPLGGVDLKKETIEEAALKELHEETGVVAGVIHCVGSFWTDPGFSNQKMHVCITTGIKAVKKQNLENTEIDLVSKRVSVNGKGDFLNNNKMQDAWSICGYYFLKNYIDSNYAEITRCKEPD